MVSTRFEDLLSLQVSECSWRIFTGLLRVNMWSIIGSIIGLLLYDPEAELIQISGTP